MLDVIIIGAGPAGITTALYTARAGLKTAILYKDFGALKKAALVDNFYGHLEVSGKDLIKTGIRQVRKVGVQVKNAEVLAISQNEDMAITVETAAATYTAKTAVIATGANRHTPRMKVSISDDSDTKPKGLAVLEGRGVSYCAICDGFFHRGKDVAILGNSAYALHEAQDLLPIAKSVTVLTNGKKPVIDFPANIIVKTGKIKEICAQSGMLGPTLKSVVLANGETLPLSGLFIALGVAGGTELARKIGAVVQNNSIYVDAHCRTTVPNIWAAGDCTGGLKQIVKAAYEGMVAGMDIIKSSKTRGVN